MAHLNPHLLFTGNAEEAFAFYKAAFGGEFATVVRYKDMPEAAGHPVSEADANKIMHIALPIGKDSVLMAGDVPEKFMGQNLETGNRYSISIHTESKEEADKLFNALSAGGKIEMPMMDSPWGSYFGMFADKFGIQWMVSFDQRQRA